MNPRLASVAVLCALALATACAQLQPAASPTTATAPATSARTAPTTALSPGQTAIVEKYQAQIPRLMAEQDITGLAVTVVDASGPVWIEGFGYTDHDKRTPVSQDTLFSVQSISKNFTAAAVLVAVQDGLLDLDEPITTYLPDFTVRSIFEEYPEQRITLRHLLSHTSGLALEAPVGNNYDLGHASLDAEARSAYSTWLRFPVGLGYAYSNMGLGLAGYILQTVSGKPFATYVDEKLLRPAGLERATFDQARILPDSNRALGHSWPLPSVRADIPIIPEGGLYASAADMSRWIRMYLNDGRVGDRTVLTQKSLEEMFTVPPPAHAQLAGDGLGIVHERDATLRNAEWLNHGGGGFGFLADLSWYPELGIGIAVLTNSVDHNLQYNLSHQILVDFVNDPGSVYQERMVALPIRAVRGLWRQLPATGRLYAMISARSMTPDSSQSARWASYVGPYQRPTWGLMSPSAADLRVSEHSDNLYLTADNQEQRLTEVSPGVLFAEDGNVFDFSGATPTWADVRIVKIGDGPALWQQGLLGLTSLVFVSALLAWPIGAGVRRLRSRKRAVGLGSRLTTAVGLLASGFGLVCAALVVAFPSIVYAGFLGWLHLPLWQRLLLHAPLALALACCASFRWLSWRGDADGGRFPSESSSPSLRQPP